MSKEKEIALKEKLGQAITILPGKTERWLMLDFRDQCRMYFQGTQEEPIAFVEIKLFGAAGGVVYQEMTAAVTRLFRKNWRFLLSGFISSMKSVVIGPGMGTTFKKAGTI